MKLGENLHDIRGNLSIQISGWLIDEKERRIIDQGAGNRHPLLFSGGESDDGLSPFS